MFRDSRGQCVCSRIRDGSDNLKELLRGRRDGLGFLHCSHDIEFTGLIHLTRHSGQFGLAEISSIIAGVGNLLGKYTPYIISVYHLHSYSGAVAVHGEAGGPLLYSHIQGFPLTNMRMLTLGFGTTVVGQELLECMGSCRGFSVYSPEELEDTVAQRINEGSPMVMIT